MGVVSVCRHPSFQLENLLPSSSSSSPLRLLLLPFVFFFSSSSSFLWLQFPADLRPEKLWGSRTEAASEEKAETLLIHRKYCK